MKYKANDYLNLLCLICRPLLQASYYMKCSYLTSKPSETKEFRWQSSNCHTQAALYM